MARRCWIGTALGLALVTPQAKAEPTSPADAEPSAAAVAQQPVPGDESGRTDPVDDGDSTGRAIGRGLLFVPKVVIDTALTPLRGGIWLWERYQLKELYERIFFNDARTIGLYPTARFESGFGITGVVGGVRFVDRDLFGEREHLAMEASAGASYYWRQLYSLSLNSGHRLGKWFRLELDAGYELRPRDPFYGIGNGDSAPLPAMPIDPRVDPTSVETRYSQTRARVALAGDARVWDDLHLRGAGSLSDRTFGASNTGLASNMVYATNGLVGWDGVRDAYGEVELRWDGRHPGTVYEPTGVPVSGQLAAVFGGRVHRLDAGSDYWRYGVDLQQFIRLGQGPRVLGLRFHGEAVTGSVDEVPFSELPMLGGSSYLRGYAPGRFRDRIAAFGSAEYQWDLSGGIAANLFGDVGRVYSGLDALAADHLRVGYGVGLEYHGGRSLRIETSLGASIDGDVFLNILFNPVYDIDERVRRR